MLSIVAGCVNPDPQQTDGLAQDPILLDNDMESECVQQTVGMQCVRDDGNDGICVAPNVCAIKCESTIDCLYVGDCRNSMCLKGACWFPPLQDGAKCGTDTAPGQCKLGTCQ